jgi:hypothetical protein
MRYLPSPQIEGFWKPLYDGIAESLRFAKVLQSRMGNFRRLESLRILPQWFCDGDDEPLLPDTKDVYLSSEYEEADIEILENLGLEQLSLDQMMYRLSRSLAKGSSATYWLDKTPLDDDWHTHFASFLAEMIRDNVTRNKVEQLDIIPLTDMRWVSPASMESAPVYLPLLVDQDPVHIEIPSHLGINTLHKTACAVGERLTLYEKLRIIPCDPEVVISKILDPYSFSHRDTVGKFRTEFEILFWFGRPNFRDKLPQAQCLSAASKHRQQRSASFLFFPSDEEYDAQKLLEFTPPDDLGDYGFLHNLYMESQVRNMIRSKKTWETWLQTCGVTYYPSLTKQQHEGREPVLSPVQKLIARDNPERFVANLKAHWSESYFVQASKSVCNELANLPVLCHDDTKKPLRSTILPTNEILARAGQWRNYLPLLKLPANSLTQGSDQWSFLRQFGVICDVGYEFYSSLLRSIRDSAGRSMPQVAILLEIYAGIAECSKIGDAPVLKVSQPRLFKIFANDATGTI